jgi:hypothetical protein
MGAYLPGCRALVLALLLIQAHAKVYTFYGVAGLSEEQFLNQWSPTFETYLSEEVSKTIPNTTFKLKATQQDMLQEKVENGEADFLFAGKADFLFIAHAVVYLGPFGEIDTLSKMHSAVFQISRDVHAL